MTFWTGAINEPFAFAAEVGFYDTTLRDGEQTVGVVLDAEQKLEIGRALDELGIERIEAGFPRVSAEDRRAIELVRDAGLRAEVWGFSRAVQADVEALLELGLTASVIESPISDLKLDALGVSREQMLERIRRAVSFAAERGVTVAYFGVDGTRADPGFFDTAYDAAVDAGAREVVVVDTLGIAAPEAVAELIGRTRERLGVPVHFHGHDDFGLATAAAVAAVRAGATWIHGTINGMGERAGNADLAEVALALRGLYGIETRLRLERVREVSSRVCEFAGYGLEPWKPLVGENLFTRGARGRGAADHAREEERPRLDPDQAGGARPRRAGRRAPTAPRAGEGAGRPRAPARHRRGVRGVRCRCQTKVTWMERKPHGIQPSSSETELAPPGAPGGSGRVRVSDQRD
jgi:isopropylmalate/homocitrate/citramalate synthase